jgi:membrane-bound lytic murein transglycosylase B
VPTDATTASDRERAEQAPTTAPVAVPDHADAPRAISDLPDAAWVTSVAAQSGIPERALRAYAGAAIAVARETPSCGIGWNTLAGIGLVESEHGTIHGSVIREDGIASPGIIGIPLTGEVSLAVPDTDGGALDGDTVWDRAVGPMQFIPETWERWGADGDGDGLRDPQHIDDSALAAARYLCHEGGDLTNPEAWIAAVHAYNPSVDYNNRVADAASHYATIEGLG